MKTFLIADTHFGHQGMCEFTRSNGEKLRPWLKSEDMDNELIERWNSVVSINDKVYHLGDVAFGNRQMQILSRLNGKKVLIKGNHDRLKPSQYLKFFKDIRAYHLLDNIILSHVPIHPISKGRFRANVHGHLHEKETIIDPWYICVSVEQTNYTPIDFEAIRTRVQYDEVMK